MNTDKCNECNSSSLEKCLMIQCPYFMNIKYPDFMDIKRDENKDKDVKAESGEE